MSRSRRKSPFVGNTCAESEKQDKRMANRALRRKSKQGENLEIVVDRRQISDVWCFAKDGKQRIGTSDSKWMRK